MDTTHDRTCTCPECSDAADDETLGFGEMLLQVDDDQPRCTCTAKPDYGEGRTFHAHGCPLHVTADCLTCARERGDDDDPTGHVFCFHGRYFIGDEHDHRSSDFSGWDEFEQHLRREHSAEWVLPVYAYIHSAIRVKVYDFHGLLPQGHAEFDSGQVGFVWCTKREARKALHQPTGPLDNLRVVRALVARVNLLDEYMNDPDRFDLDD